MAFGGCSMKREILEFIADLIACIGIFAWLYVLLILGHALQ